MTEADMTWRRANGTIGEYHGELIDLGMGIPRHVPEWGIRRAAWDFALGYASGFPLRDIIPYVLRSLIPSRTSIVTVDAQPITCEVPPPGWWCSREADHDGPCAAHPWRDDPRLTAGTRYAAGGILSGSQSFEVGSPGGEAYIPLEVARARARRIWDEIDKGDL